jgi:hypothetical protein
LLALHGDAPVERGSPLIRELGPAGAFEQNRAVLNSELA